MNKWHYLCEGLASSRRLLVSTGFTNAEIGEFSAVNREQMIACGVLSAIECGCDPSIWRDEAYRNRDPFEALSKMTEAEKLRVREYADASLDEFVTEEQRS
jgi:hypothetical protein